MSRQVTFPADLTLDALRSKVDTSIQPLMAQIKGLCDLRKAIKVKMDATPSGMPPFAELGEMAARSAAILEAKGLFQEEIGKSMRARRRLLGSQVDFEAELMMRQSAEKLARAIGEVNEADGGLDPNDIEKTIKETLVDPDVMAKTFEVDPAKTPALLPNRDQHVAFLAELNAVLDDPSAALPTIEAREGWYWKARCLVEAQEAHEGDGESDGIGSSFFGMIVGKTKVRNVYHRAISRAIGMRAAAGPLEILGDENLYNAAWKVRSDYLTYRYQYVQAIERGEVVCGECGEPHHPDAEHGKTKA